MSTPPDDLIQANLSQLQGSRAVQQMAAQRREAISRQTPKPTLFQGFDGDVPLVQRLGDEVTSAREIVTTGAIGVGDTVIMRGGSRIDALQRVKVATVAETVVAPKYPVKILFSTIEETERVFWVGGDRQEPERVFALPASTNIVSTTLTNTGETSEDWVVSLAWTDAGVTGQEPLTYVANIEPNQTVELAADRAHSYLEPRGNNFWSSRFVAAQTIGDNFNGLYGEPSTAVRSGTGGSYTDTLTTPTVLTGVYSVTQVGDDPFNNSSFGNGTSSNKGFGFWAEALEVEVGVSNWSRTTVNSSPGGFIQQEGEIIVMQPGAVYLAPGLPRDATTVDYVYGFSGGQNLSTSQINKRQRQYALWETLLCGDRFALVQSRTETVDRDVRVISGVQTVFSDVDESTHALVLVDRSGDLPDAQVNADLQVLLDERRNDPTFNLVETSLWEADIYNNNDDPEAPAFTATILQADVELNINQYDLSASSATPETQTAAVLSFNQADEAVVTIHAASYYPD